MTPRWAIASLRGPEIRNHATYDFSLVENTFGVLTRVAGMFSGRGYNIDSLNVAPTHDPEKSRMTIVTRGDDATVEQIVRQLYKLVNVLEITDFREHEYIDRELVMVRVKATAKNRSEVCRSRIFSAPRLWMCSRRP